MNEHRTTTAQTYPLAEADVIQAAARRSPLPGLVAITIHVTPDEAYRIADACARSYQAGLAGQICDAAFHAKYDSRPLIAAEPGE